MEVRRNMTKITPFPGDRARELAGDLYKRARDGTPTKQAALDALHRLLNERRDLVPAWAPRPDRDTLGRWAAEDTWEERVVRDRAERSLAIPTLDADARLGELVQAVQWARDVLDKAYGHAARDNATAGDVQRWQSAYKTWSEAQERVRKIEDEIRRRSLERVTTREWRDRHADLTEDLLGEYGDLGPQYRVLVKRLAALEIKIEQMEESGRDVDPAEYGDLSKNIVATIGQMQKHTEAVQVEAVKQAVDAATRKLLDVFARHVQISQEAWEAIIGDVKEGVA